MVMPRQVIKPNIMIMRRETHPEYIHAKQQTNALRWHKRTNKKPYAGARGRKKTMSAFPHRSAEEEEKEEGEEEEEEEEG